ncbi:bifunctional diguanylate cyclase/phosphodiesterase [Sneathiella sp. CAU 1612]|uniref:Bifunctional diguanylate cyclase/phosphodiesterase n=1 Tax=Sneathiella sedimenti TaxID=2816034 RepID=A0ABS3F9R8_9PROT|nr:bifunctional diguanylate cyclase/phosphodiesterase [Sneathiella sedimenti]MBO0335269.1 bifunctional diguanylate cyclase/phosphodiesterase [Sneathiella sedimenti]
MNTRGLASKRPTGHDPAGITQSAAQYGPALKLNYNKLRLLVLETGDHILNFCNDINIPIAAHENSYNESVAKDIAAGVYNCIIIDGADGDCKFTDVLEETSNKPPFLPVIVIDGSLNLLRAGASENIASKDLSAERLETALFNADRLCKLNNRTAILEMELSAFIEEDPLTALPGRSKFRVRMAKAIEKAHNAKKSVSLIILDLNSFKELNESRGHDFGDEVLKTVAKRLFKFAPYNSIVGRLGDDEFALLAVDQNFTKEAGNIAARLQLEIRKPYIIEGQKTDVSATIGLAQLDDHDTADGLLHKSISALYAAKRDKVPFTVYTHEDDVERRQQLRLAQDLPDAVINNQLLLNYQPIVRISDQQVIGVEALVRWMHPKQGLIFPDSFIPLAEGSGSIEALTEWVLEEGIRQGSRWLADGNRLSVSVNISALILHNPSFPDMVARKLENIGFPAELLKLEITESAIISDVSRATEIVNRLHEMGVCLSIDDFGTGYTSLAYLRKLPVDEIKIDKSFVMNMMHAADDEVIVRTLLDLAKSLGLSVVAEGVEDALIWRILEALDCDVAQGYFMSRPVDIDTFNAWLKVQPWKDELK